MHTVERTAERLRGAFTFLAVSNAVDGIFGIKHNASLIIGLGEQENFVASDMLALSPNTSKGIILEDDEVLWIKKDKVVVQRFGRQVEKKVFELSSQNLSKSCPDYMQKEIEEIPDALLATGASLASPEGLKKLPLNVLKNLDSVYLAGCGTAYHACLYGKQVLERFAGLPCEAVYASEVRSNALFFNPKKLAVFVSQSGETCDTLASLKLAKAMGSFTVAITNVRGSSITFIADFCLYTDCGSEIAVAATKSYNSQLLSLYFFAVYLGEILGVDSDIKYASISQITANLAVQTRKIVCMDTPLRIAEKHYKNFAPFFIGRGLDLTTALEGALKLKEITYLPTEALPAGELKHGTIARIDESALVFAIATSEAEKCKLLSSIKEVSARGAKTVVICNSGFENYDKILLPENDCELLYPILSVIPLQRYALAVARLLGLDADKPKNLAKSVTVQ